MSYACTESEFGCFWSGSFLFNRFLKSTRDLPDAQGKARRRYVAVDTLFRKSAFIEASGAPILVLLQRRLCIICRSQSVKGNTSFHRCLRLPHLISSSLAHDFGGDVEEGCLGVISMSCIAVPTLAALDAAQCLDLS